MDNDSGLLDFVFIVRVKRSFMFVGIRIPFRCIVQSVKLGKSLIGCTLFQDSSAKKNFN